MKLKKWIKPLLLVSVALGTTAIVAPIVVSCGDNPNNNSNPPPNLETSYNISFKELNASYDIGDKGLLVDRVDSYKLKQLITENREQIFNIEGNTSPVSWTQRLDIINPQKNKTDGSVKFVCKLNRSINPDNSDLISNTLTITGFKYYGNTPIINSSYNPSEVIKNAGFTEEDFNKIVDNYRNCKHIYSNGQLNVNEFTISLEGDQFIFLYLINKTRWEGYRFNLTKNSEGKYKVEFYWVNSWNPEFDVIYSKDELKKDMEDWFYNHKD